MGEELRRRNRSTRRLEARVRQLRKETTEYRLRSASDDLSAVAPKPSTVRIHFDTARAFAEENVVALERMTQEHAPDANVRVLDGPCRDRTRQGVVNPREAGRGLGCIAAFGAFDGGAEGWKETRDLEHAGERMVR